MVHGPGGVCPGRHGSGPSPHRGGRAPRTDREHLEYTRRAGDLGGTNRSGAGARGWFWYCDLGRLRSARYLRRRTCREPWPVKRGDRKTIDPILETGSKTPITALTLSATPVGAETFSADVWADNWFEVRIDGVQVAEDSVPITTERSFNAESFNFEAVIHTAPHDKSCEDAADPLRAKALAGSRSRTSRMAGAAPESTPPKAAGNRIHRRAGRPEIRAHGAAATATSTPSLSSRMPRGSSSSRFQRIACLTTLPRSRETLKVRFEKNLDPDPFQRA